MISALLDAYLPHFPPSNVQLIAFTASALGTAAVITAARDIYRRLGLRF